MFCSLVYVLVNSNAKPSMVAKFIFKIETLWFQVFIKDFKIFKFVVFIFFLMEVFFSISNFLSIAFWISWRCNTLS